MKKFFPALAFLVIGGIIGFVIGMKNPQKSAAVDLTVVNNSRKQVNSVTLIHEHGSQTITDIRPQEKMEMKLYANGETSYILEVSFADGTKLSSAGRYAEAGYEITETINENRITSDFYSSKS